MDFVCIGKYLSTDNLYLSTKPIKCSNLVLDKVKAFKSTKSEEGILAFLSWGVYPKTPFWYVYY